MTGDNISRQCIGRSNEHVDTGMASFSVMDAHAYDSGCSSFLGDMTHSRILSSKG